MNEVTLTGQATPEQIAQWKTENPDGIYAVVIEKSRIIYFKNPNRNDLNAVFAKRNTEATYSLYEILAAITCLGGDKTILDEDQAFIGLADKMKSKLEGKSAELVNL